MTITEAALSAWYQSYFWPFLRIGGLVLAAPLFSAQAVPPRVRLMLALALSVALAPLLPATAALASFSAPWWLEIGRELAVGVGLGLLLQLVFEAVMLAGELVSYGMGLGFAQLADPLHGASAPMLGQFYQVFAALLFFSLGGHLHLVQMVADSFQRVPAGQAVPTAASFLAVASGGGSMFAGALQIALPAVAALLLVNIAFGVMNRSAPALNMLSIGFPLSLVVGLVLLRLTIAQLQPVLVAMLDQAWASAAGWTQDLR
ncbi:MAG: flagellar biosynthetic protein FliR [Nevskia sp.]|nr:flagellar biosynthetic protein FliR [Nevskia sp.]